MSSPSRLPAALGRILLSGIQGAVIAALALGDPGHLAVARAAEEPSEPAAEPREVSSSDLDELVGPIALYPDELLAVVLPASTYPLQIVQAARLLEKRKTDPELQPDEEWDESILGILNYPDVVNLMNEDLNWTWKLGEAVAEQQVDVMDAIQLFRAKVDDAGNLESMENVNVVRESQDNQQIIVIESSSPEVIYVPTYQPSTVVVYQTTPYPYYYSRPYPYYWSPAATFWTGMFVGAAIGWGVSWGRRGYGSSITVNRNVNVNVNRPGSPSQRPSGGGRGESWKADKGRGTQSGARPGGGSGTRPSAGTGTRPSAGSGSRPSAGTGQRPSAGTGKAPSTRPAQSGTGAGRGDRASRGSGGASSGRGLTSPSTSQRASKGGSLGSYNKGSSTRAHSARGKSSRGGGGRGGGGRGGGGGRRR